MSIKKYIITGHILEVYEYEKFICGHGGKEKKEPLEELKKEINETTLLNYVNHNKVRQNEVRRLTCANFDKLSTFVTLTFDNKKVQHDIHNVKECNYQFKKFIQKLKRYLIKEKYPNELKYLAVIEFQDTNDRRAVHYHVVFNLPFIPHKDLENLWAMGYVYIEKINHVDNVGAYLIKYMTKDSADERLMGLPAYLRSKNLIEPSEIILTNTESDRLSSEYYKLDTIISNNTAIYEAEYDTEFMGKCQYRQYNLDRK